MGDMRKFNSRYKKKLKVVDKLTDSILEFDGIEAFVNQARPGTAYHDIEHIRFTKWFKQRYELIEFEKQECAPVRRRESVGRNNVRKELTLRNLKTNEVEYYSSIKEFMVKCGKSPRCPLAQVLPTKWFRDTYELIK